ncbi:MAG: 3-phosphoshikimate 1-carboxyvinyltransferase [Chitinivibrionales bacterium]|nr:3-phosphoshikimate 1-carboxyvinyltransferase [Chitinivibrionales bacterium]
MKWRVRKSRLSGVCRIPPSKSHSIRAVLIATLADGHSTIRTALTGGDGASALKVAQIFGANVNEHDGALTISGLGGDLGRGGRECDCGNSGTTMRLFAGAAALGEKTRRFDGDRSLRTRKMVPLLDALKKLGARYTLLGDGAEVPFSISGPIRGGSTEVSGVTSQFVSSLLLCAPLAEQDSTIRVVELNERPYVELTLWWLERMGVPYSASDDLSEIRVHGGCAYPTFDMDIPGDFSSATFPAVAAALTGCEITLTGLDFTDPQGDKRVFDIMADLGCGITKGGMGVNVAPGDRLQGGDIDLNANPDALPALAVLATAAEGVTRLGNVPQARYKETDRIDVMTHELRKLGATVTDEPDALVVERSTLRGAVVEGHDDHRVVMALALAGMAAEGETIIEGAQAAAITYPSFLDDFRALGADIEAIND